MSTAARTTTDAIVTEYAFADGAHLAGAEMGKIAAALRDIASKNDGRIDPAAVVEAARPAHSPMHAFIFDRDDAAAAAEYRLERARLLIRSVRVTLSTTGGPVVVRPFVHMPERNAYCETEEVMRSKELRTALVARALGELESWKARYRVYAELAALYESIDAGIAKVKAGAA